MPSRSEVSRLLLPLLAAAALAAGLALRNWTWGITGDIHWKANPQNAFVWGARVVDTAQNSTTPPTAASAITWPQFFRAYASTYEAASREPMSDTTLDYPPLRLLVVALWVRHIRRSDPDAAAWQPEYTEPMLGLNSLCAAAAAFLMFVLVRHWMRRREDEGGTARAAVAALLLWFNPAAILESHGWPQWDIWPVPFFLGALLLASLDRWVAAGAVIALGSLFKGQLLLVAPLFVLWPLAARRPRAALRALAGFAVTFTAVVSPWLATGSTAWLHVGFITGLTKYGAMARNCASNLPSILGRFGWTLSDTVAAVSVRTLLGIVYGLTLVACAAGAAAHERRNDPRFLVAATAPWVLMFALLGQMDGRYLLYGACVTAAVVAVDARLAVVHVLLTAMNFAMMLQFLLAPRPEILPAVQRGLAAANPALAWFVLACAAVLLHVACVPPRKPAAEDLEEGLSEAADA